MGLTVPQRRPLETIEGLNDRGLEAIRTNFETLFNDTVVQADSFALTAADLNSVLADYSDGYMKVSGGALAIQAAPIPVTDGGTGLASYAVGDLLYASGASTLSKLADVAAGSYLRSGGVGVAPAWSTATLPNTATTGDLLYASGANVYANLADVATGNALISGGIGVAPSWGKVGLTTHVSGTLAVGNGGTGTATGFTAGSIVFAGTSGVYAQDNANLFWDDTNNFLGIGTSGPNSIVYINKASGQAKVTLVAADGTNDAWFNFETNNNEWSFGIDKSDSNRFKLSNGDTIGTSDYIVVDGSGHVMVGVTGSAGSPVLSYTSDSNTGIYFDGSDALKFATAGTLGLTLDASQNLLVVGQVQGKTGSASSPTYAASTDGNTGMYFDAGGDILRFATGGTLGLSIDASQNLVIVGQTQAKTGTAGSPSYAFSSDGNTGIYGDASDGLFFSNNGTESARFTSAGVLQLASNKNLKFQGTGVPDFAGTATGSTTCTLGSNSPSAGTTPFTWIKVAIAGGAGTYYIPAFT